MLKFENSSKEKKKKKKFTLSMKMLTFILWLYVPL